MPTLKRRVKAAITKSRLPELGKPIFTDKITNIIPGYVIIQLGGHDCGIIIAITNDPSRGHSVSGLSSFGVSKLDSTMVELKVTSVTRLTPPASSIAVVDETAVALASSFNVRYESEISGEADVEKLSGVAEVDYAEANRYCEIYAVPNDSSFPDLWGLTSVLDLKRYSLSLDNDRAAHCS